MDEESRRYQGAPKPLREVMRTRFSKKIGLTVFIIALIAVVIFAVVNFAKKAVVVPAPRVVPPATTQVEHRVIGKSVDGRSIDAYIYGSGPTHLLFVGGIHGGYEWNSVVLAYQFMDYLKAYPWFIPKNITIAVIPSANPDGVYRVVGKEGRFTALDIPTTILPDGTGRFNADNVDINRNFDCKWQPKSTWKNNVVSAGTKPFSEPEAAAIRDFVSSFTPDGAVFWHSQANGVYASQCKTGILPKTLDIMNAYSQASGYNAIKTFDAYAVTGASEDWLASQDIPAITVELKTHTTVEWAQNLAGIKAIINYYSQVAQ